MVATLKKRDITKIKKTAGYIHEKLSETKFHPYRSRIFQAASMPACCAKAKNIF